MPKVFLLVFALVLSNLTVGQNTLNNEEKKHVVNKVSKQLQKHNVLPKEGQEMLISIKKI